VRAARLGSALAATAVLVGVGVHGLGGSAATPAAMGTPAVVAKPRLVLVSGRDDHGMVVADRVPLYDEPEGERSVSSVHDGTLMEVLSVDGQWLEVRAVEGPAAIGWVDDFFLRGQARLVGPAPSCRTEVDGEQRDGGTLVVVRELRQGRVWVETVSPPVVNGWAPREDLQELPPQGASCGDIPPEDKHAHQH
jgi:hypothetical protein